MGDCVNRFQRHQRIRKSKDFEAVYSGRLFASDDVLVINGRRRREAASRLGLSVSRKVGNAVVRNRWKRQIREAFRTQQQQVPAGWDFVVRPRKGAALDHARVRRSLLQLTRRIANRGKRVSGKPSKDEKRSRQGGGR